VHPDESQDEVASRPRLSFAILGTYPPTSCGIATFTAALAQGLVQHGSEVGIVRVGDASTPSTRLVVAELSDRDSVPSRQAIDALDDADVVVVQHEYGLYAGVDGAGVVDVLESIDRPSIVVAHTVLQAPSPHQRDVLRAIADRADAVVAMTVDGRTRLCRDYEVDPSKVVVIAHGAAVPARRRDGHEPVGTGLLTWGLLGPGKGIEWAIDAVAQLTDIRPRVRYRIAGDTHPKVVASDGEAYRHMLRQRARDAGITNFVRLDAGYRDVPALSAMARESAIVVLPYDSPDQATSGVLVDAVAAGRPVVATAFPHAVELLASGAGVVVPRQDPDALADAIRSILTDPAVAAGMAAEARRLAPGLAWSTVASEYAALGERLLAARRGAERVAAVR
jgi:glycosyltransferase involved in cell wall biosynthesis